MEINNIFFSLYIQLLHLKEIIYKNLHFKDET
jgi:hypothetical protein